MFTSYAQNFEDVMLWRALRHVDCGFYVDIGAQDAIVDSVSMGFYEQGWRGVHVEPVEGYAQQLRELRPDERVIQAAVGAQPGALTLYQFEGTGLTTALRDVAARHVASGFAMREVSVPCTTLEQILASCAGRDIHWMKIDVEGFERQALEGWRGEVRPWVVVVESTVPGTEAPAYGAWEPMLMARGYRFVWFDGLNRFYVCERHPELERAFDHGAAVFDDFALSGTASASFCSIVNARADGARREAAASAARASEVEAQLERSSAEARELRSGLDAAEAHAAAMQAHVEAMVNTLSWRMTSPLRRLREVLGPAPAADGMPARGLARRLVDLAKRSGIYSRVAPWMRERYPGHWSRAKRWLLEGAPSRIESSTDDSTGAGRALLGTSIPHSADAIYRAVADSNSLSVDALSALLEQEIARQRKA
jgi:FkbM family methyltransferase